jgi:hypothetical protein
MKRGRMNFRLVIYSVALLCIAFLVNIFLREHKVHASSTDFYYAQTAAGAGTGTDCNDAYAYNDSTNGMIHKAAAGVTLHVCSTWTGSTAQQWAAFTTSGTSGSPITLKFESGSLIQAPYHSTSGGFNFNNLSWWVIDFGISAGVNSSCNIVNVENGTCAPQMQNTSNGGATAALSTLTVAGGTTTAVCTGSCQPYINAFNTSDVVQVSITGTGVASCNVHVTPLTSSGTTFTFATPSGCTSTTGGTVGSICPAGACTNSQDSIFIQALNVSNLEVRNGNLGPAYVHTLLSQDANARIVNISGSNTSFHDMTIHDGGGNTGGSPALYDETSYGNNSSVQFFNVDAFHGGWLMGVAGGAVILADMEVYNNHLHDIGMFADNGFDAVHGNIAHYYNLSGGGVGKLYWFNNLIDGDMGPALSGIPFLEGQNCGSTTNDWATANVPGTSPGQFIAFNNVIVANTPSGHPPGSIPSLSCGSGHFYANNYTLGPGSGSTNNATLFGSGPLTGGTGVTVLNNVIQSGDVALQNIGGSVVIPVLIDFNVYGDLSGGNNFWQITGSVNTSTFSTYQAAGWDAHGHATTGSQVANISHCRTFVCGSGIPSAGYVGLAAGTNLTSMCSTNSFWANLCFDSTAGGTHSATARPATGTNNWPIGAFQASSAPSPNKFSGGIVISGGTSIH